MSGITGRKTPSVARTLPRGDDLGTMKVTKLSSTTVTLPTTWVQKTPAPEPTPAPPPVEQQPTPTSDPLQIAAQIYPWTFMSSTLDACFKNAEAAAINDLETRAKELSAEESEISDQRDRLEAERAIGIYEELGTDKFAKEAPAIMQLFHSHGDSCARVETDAIKLANQGPPNPDLDEPLKVYNDMLDVLEELQKEASNLQNSITKLTSTSTTPATDDSKNHDLTAAEEASSAQSQIIGVFAACLPILRARVANLSMAQDLIDSALENVSLGLRMESMGLTD
ncbi:hypothetical protein B0H34DRAFT_690015 [Crassisporium funariophilum]|nr:hypothetical protein B0H34DRAFT_690015 [Crassisporium funariophilum]